jgi:hypothetical protein
MRMLRVERDLEENLGFRIERNTKHGTDEF